MKGLILSVLLLGTLGAHATPTFDNSISDATKTQILQDLEFVKTINGATSSAMYKQIFANNGINGADLIGFFDARIKNFGANDCGGGPSVAACVIPWYSSSTMWITPNYQKNNIPQIYRVSIIYHESRHTETVNNNWPHATCPTPYRDENGKDIVGIISGMKMEGLPACDRGTMGAYGMQAVLLKNVERSCATCNEKLRMDAKLFGDDGALRISDLNSRAQLRADQ